jgi:hypothetical protein
MTISNDREKEFTMTKKNNEKTTFEEFMDAKTPNQKKDYADGYRNFLLSELILAAMEEDHVSVRKLAKIADVSPTIVQDMKSGNKVSFNTKSLFKILTVLGYDILLERNGTTTSLGLTQSIRK